MAWQGRESVICPQYGFCYGSYNLALEVICEVKPPKVTYPLVIQGQAGVIFIFSVPMPGHQGLMIYLATFIGPGYGCRLHEQILGFYDSTLF